VIADDILVFGAGKTREESEINHDHNVLNLFETLRKKKHIKLNDSKV